MSRILITGKTGQVGYELERSLQGLGEIIALDRSQMDLADLDQVRDVIRRIKPTLIVNPAAYTAVDKAESEPELALRINGEAPGLMAEEAKKLGAAMIHYSTDYVFDGTKPAPYTESDTPNPLGVYGQSKLAGEQAIAAAGGEYLILRTSWVYSSHGKNFLLTMQRLLQEKPQMRIVADQIGAPTWAGTIANSTRVLIEQWQAGKAGDWGVYHLTAQGETSWFGFAQAIGEQLRAEGKACAELEAIPSSAYPTPAQRPLNSRLDCSRLQQQWHVSQPHWQDALRKCLAGQH